MTHPIPTDPTPPTLEQVLEMLARYVEISQAWDGVDGNHEAQMIEADKSLFALSPAHLRAQVDQIKALRDQRNLLEFDNDGHAEYLGILHHVMKEELPDHNNTELLGNLLERWGRTYGERQYMPRAEFEQAHADALARAQEREAGLREALEQAQGELERVREALVEVEGEKERWFERYLELRNLFDLPRLQGGVLSIAHDVDPARPTGTLSTTVLRHERRGRMREVELGWRDKPMEGLQGAPWRDRVIPAGDLLEALKVPMAHAMSRAALAPADAQEGVG